MPVPLHRLIVQTENILPALINQDLYLGAFRARILSGTNTSFRIWHASQPGNYVFSSPTSKAFVKCSFGRIEFRSNRGMISATDKISASTTAQSINLVSLDGNRLILSGVLSGQGAAADYEVEIFESSPKSVSFEIRIFQSDTTAIVVKTVLCGQSSSDEMFSGLGAQFAGANLKGRRYPLLVSEQGIGRGRQPVTLLADLFGNGAGGKFYSTSSPAATFISNNHWGFSCANYEFATFDFRHSNEYHLEVATLHWKGTFFFSHTPRGLLSEISAMTGRPRAIPDWTSSGAILGLQGGTNHVLEIVHKAKDAGFPVSGIWIQDWCGQRRTIAGQQVQWNWKLDRDLYHGWDEFVAELSSLGIRILGYFNPFLAKPYEDLDESDALFAIAERNGFLVMNPNGSSHLVRNTDFDAGLIDLTNEVARSWIKEIIRNELVNNGFSGWMADYGEALPTGAVLAANRSTSVDHNMYPDLWAQLNQEILEENGLARDGVFFVRSGYTNTARYSNLHWLGDQLVSWDQFDGLKSAINGLLTGGVSGQQFNHSDIGGFTTLDLPIFGITRSRELLQRWSEFAVFTDIFRTHEGNDPSANTQFYSDERTLYHFGRMARLFKSLSQYRRYVQSVATLEGLPCARLLYLHYPNDRIARQFRSDTFLFGEDILVSPVTQAGIRHKQVYVPQGQWFHPWSGQQLQTGVNDIECPLGQPPFFIRMGTRWAHTIVVAMKEHGLIGPNEWPEPE